MAQVLAVHAVDVGGGDHDSLAESRIFHHRKAEVDIHREPFGHNARNIEDSKDPSCRGMALGAGGILA